VVPYTEPSVLVNVDTTDMAVITASGGGSITGPLTIANPSGTPGAGDLWRVSVCSTGAYALTFGTQFRAGYGPLLPTKTTGSAACDLFGFQRDTTNAFWDVISTTQSSQNALVKSCVLGMGHNNGPVLVDADLSQTRMCPLIGSSGTIVEVGIYSDAGTPSVAPHRRKATTNTALITSAGTIAPAAGGAYACVRLVGGGSQNGESTCSAGLQNQTYSGETTLGFSSGTAGGTAKALTVIVFYIPSN
jgi:hypothetical protein